MRVRIVSLLLLGVCTLVSTRARAQAAGGPIRLQDCRWVLVVPHWWEASSFAIPKEFVRIQAISDRSLVSRELSLKGLEPFFQTASARMALVPNGVEWDPSSLADHDHKQLFRLRCPGFGPYDND